MPKDRKSQKPTSSPASAGAAPSAGALVVTAQQSRFHLDALEAPESKEIDVKDVSITLGGKEILSHADIKLQEGFRYVLVGRNGYGKSTLLKALGENRIPGIPWNLRVLLLGQTNSTTESIDERMVRLQLRQQAEGTVLEHVIRSDAHRERALRESKSLSVALENSADPISVIRAVRQLKHERLARELAEMREIAARRSGARGAKARKDLIALEERVLYSQALLDQKDSEIDSAAVQTETLAAVDMLTVIQESLEAMDASGAESRARTVLLGLGFPAANLDKPFTTLSGGWRTRCSLACALFQPADVLLLDEPTNFLDLPAVIWLQAYLQRTSTTTLVVTHDRDFADAVADELLVMRDKGLERFRGNLSTYERERRQRARYLSRMKDAQERRARHTEDSLVQSVRAARRAGDDKKLRQAASRKRKIEERSGLEVGMRGGRFKVNRDLPGYHNSVRAAIEVPTDEPPVRIALPSQPPDLRFLGALVAIEKASYAYPRGPWVLRDVDLVIHPGERVGLAGLNGSGKSTLVSLAVGAVTPRSGTVKCHPRARMRCFSQHSVEELEQIQDSSATALGELLAAAGGELDEPEARKVLGSLGLQGRTVSEVPITSLSGGQKVRLALANLVWSPPHLLVLDEVTTHLDSDTVLALVEALRGFEGALLVVTHDRFFMRCVVEGASPHERSEDDDNDSSSTDEEEEPTKGWQAKPGVVYRLVKGQLERLEGGMKQYEEIAAKKAAKHLKSS